MAPRHWSGRWIRNFLECACELIANGAEVNLNDPDDCFKVLTWATQKGNLEVCKLVERDCLASKKTKNNNLANFLRQEI